MLVTTSFVHVLHAFGCVVQDVQLHGSRRLVSAAMSSSTSIRPRNSEILEQPCQESSVEQPAESNARSMDSAAWPRLLRCAGCAFVVDPDDAEQPASSPVYSFHAYNVGWNITDKERDAWWLGTEVVRDWKENKFHAIGISEVFEVEYLADEIEKVDHRRQSILEGLVKRLNAQACAGWCGQQDAHTLYIWHESLNLLDSDFVSLQVPKQSWRKTQYFLFQPADCSAPLHIYHSHYPLAGNKKRKARKTGHFQTARGNE